MEKKHLLICGAVGVGKTTLVRRLLAHSKRPLFGFSTLRLAQAGEDGLRPVYMYPAALGESERENGEENLLARCSREKKLVRSEVFDTLGVRLLHAERGGIVLMDELGFLESDALAFQHAVLAALDADTPVAAVVKAQDTPFLARVKTHENAALYTVTAQNRDELYAQLLPWIEQWNKA